MVRNYFLIPNPTHKLYFHQQTIWKQSHTFLVVLSVYQFVMFNESNISLLTLLHFFQTSAKGPDDHWGKAVQLMLLHSFLVLLLPHLGGKQEGESSVLLSLQSKAAAFYKVGKLWQALSYVGISPSTVQNPKYFRHCFPDALVSWLFDQRGFAC